MSEELVKRIGRLRAEAGAENTDAPASGRPQMNEVDATIVLAAHLSSQGIKGMERGQAIGSVKIGTTVSAAGVAKTTLSRAEKMSRALAWAEGLTEDQRQEFMSSDRFEALTDRQQEVISQAIVEADSKAYDDSIGIASDDFNWEASVDIDQLPKDETESVGDSFDVIEDEDVQSFDIDDADPWEGDVV